MHGIILTELEKFVTQHYGADAWREVQRPAELPPKVSVTSATYPDTDVVALMSAASALTGKPASEVMEADEIALQEPSAC
jgi:hypothetical protein